MFDMIPRVYLNLSFNGKTSQQIKTKKPALVSQILNNYNSSMNSTLKKIKKRRKEKLDVPCQESNLGFLHAIHSMMLRRSFPLSYRTSAWENFNSLSTSALQTFLGTLHLTSVARPEENKRRENHTRLF